MININLLIKPPPLVSRRMLIGALVTAIVLGLGSFVSYTAYLDRQRLQAEVADTQELISAYSDGSAQLSELQQKIAAVEAQNAATAALGRNQRFSQSAILHAVLVTPVGVNITHVTFEGQDVTIRGESRTFAGAMSYLSYLRVASGMKIVAERTAHVDATDGTKFEYTARVRGEVTQP